MDRRNRTRRHNSKRRTILAVTPSLDLALRPKRQRRNSRKGSERYARGNSGRRNPGATLPSAKARFPAGGHEPDHRNVGEGHGSVAEAVGTGSPATAVQPHN